jgi:hypothetical protein
VGKESDGVSIHQRQILQIRIYLAICCFAFQQPPQLIQPRALKTAAQGENPFIEDFRSGILADGCYARRWLVRNPNLRPRLQRWIRQPDVRLRDGVNRHKVVA